MKETSVTATAPKAKIKPPTTTRYVIRRNVSTMLPHQRGLLKACGIVGNQSMLAYMLGMSQQNLTKKLTVKREYKLEFARAVQAAVQSVGGFIALAELCPSKCDPSQYSWAALPGFGISGADWQGPYQINLTYGQPDHDRRRGDRRQGGAAA